MQFLKVKYMLRRKGNSEKGFTLIELITVILLLGIIGVMGSDIITTSFRAFSETDARMELFEEGKLALMRMEREIHHMVPNSIDNPSNATSIRFGLIDVNTLNSSVTPITGQYEPVGAAPTIRDLSNNALNGALISIYNTNWTDFTSNNPAIRKIYLTTATGINMTLNRPVIGGHSATKRYYPVQTAVRYYLNSNILFRAETPITLATTSDFAATLSALAGFPLLSNIDTSINPFTFNYTPASLTSNALVRINFTLSRNGNSLDFHKEIQVRNVP